MIRQNWGMTNGGVLHHLIWQPLLSSMKLNLEERFCPSNWNVGRKLPVTCCSDQNNPEVNSHCASGCINAGGEGVQVKYKISADRCICSTVIMHFHHGKMNVNSCSVTGHIDLHSENSMIDSDFDYSKRDFHSNARSNSSHISLHNITSKMGFTSYFDVGKRDFHNSSSSSSDSGFMDFNSDGSKTDFDSDSESSKTDSCSFTSSVKKDRNYTSDCISTNSHCETISSATFHSDSESGRIVTGMQCVTRSSSGTFYSDGESDNSVNNVCYEPNPSSSSLHSNGSSVTNAHRETVSTSTTFHSVCKSDQSRHDCQTESCKGTPQLGGGVGPSVMSDSQICSLAESLSDPNFIAQLQIEVDLDRNEQQCNEVTIGTDGHGGSSFPDQFLTQEQLKEYIIGSEDYTFNKDDFGTLLLPDLEEQDLVDSLSASLPVYFVTDPSTIADLDNLSNHYDPSTHYDPSAHYDPLAYPSAKYDPPLYCQSSAVTSHSAVADCVRATNHFVDCIKSGIQAVSYSDAATPSSHTAPDEDLTYDSYEEEKRVKIGEEYQAVIPELLKDHADDENAHRELETLVWDNNKVANIDVGAYLKEVHAANYQRLPRTPHLPKDFKNSDGIPLCALHDNGYDPEKALQCLREREPFISNPLWLWSEEECTRFDKAIKWHKKNFSKLQEVVGTRTAQEVRHYYYVWKKHGDKEGKKMMLKEGPLEDQDEEVLNEGSPWKRPRRERSTSPVRSLMNCKHKAHALIQEPMSARSSPAPSPRPASPSTKRLSITSHELCSSISAPTDLCASFTAPIQFCSNVSTPIEQLSSSCSAPTELNGSLSASSQQSITVPGPSEKFNTKSKKFNTKQSSNVHSSSHSTVLQHSGPASDLRCETQSSSLVNFTLEWERKFDLNMPGTSDVLNVNQESECRCHAYRNSDASDRCEHSSKYTCSESSSDSSDTSRENHRCKKRVRGREDADRFELEKVGPKVKYFKCSLGSSPHGSGRSDMLNSDTESYDSDAGEDTILIYTQRIPVRSVSTSLTRYLVRLSGSVKGHSQI